MPGRSGVIAAFFAALLLGCAATSVKDDFSFDENKNDGIVVVSVSHDRKDGTHAAVARFHMDWGAVDKDTWMVQSREELLLLGSGMFKESEFDGVFGRLFAINMPAGKHELNGWQVSSQGALIEPRVQPTALAFDVKAGEVKYIGNLHIHMDTGRNIFGMAVTGGGIPEIRDERERDLAAFKKRFPKLDKSITVGLLPLGFWAESPRVSREYPNLSVPRTKR
jgi:hypothetical protein